LNNLSFIPAFAAAVAPENNIEDRLKCFFSFFLNVVNMENFIEDGD
jgi:hypothetical protein